MNRLHILALFAVVIMGCTQKRENALRELTTRKAQCAVADLTLTAEQMLAKCAIHGDDVQNYIDLLFGAQASAMKAGATLPPDASAGAMRR